MSGESEKKVMVMILWEGRHELVTCDLNDEEDLDAIEVAKSDDGKYRATLGGNPLGERDVLMAFEIERTGEDELVEPKYPLTLEITLHEFYDRVMRARTARGWVE